MRNWGFIGPTYAHAARTVNAQRTINLIPCIDESGTSKVPTHFIHTPGTRPRVTGLDGPIRAGVEVNGRAFCLGTTGFYELLWDGTTLTATLRGSVAYSWGQPTMHSNGKQGNQVFIVAAGAGYIYDLSTDTLTQITDPQFPSGAIMGAWTDGYFAVLHGDYHTWSISTLADGTSWPGDSAQRQFSADQMRSLFVASREIALFGQKRNEWWYNSGDSFPFLPIQADPLTSGIAGAFAFGVVHGTPYWIGSRESGGLCAFAGSGGTRISNAVIEQEWKTYVSGDDIWTWCYEQGTRGFFNVTFPQDKRTWSFDTLTQQWFERRWFNQATSEQEHHLARCAFTAFGMTLVGSRLSGTLYELADDCYDDDGGQKVWSRAAPHLWQEQDEIEYPRAEALVQAGVGVPNTASDDPHVLLDYSDDGGETWSHARTATVGKQGQYRHRAIFPLLGVGRSRTFRLSGSHACPWTILDLILDVAPTRGRNG